MEKTKRRNFARKRQKEIDVCCGSPDGAVPSKREIMKRKRFRMLAARTGQQRGAVRYGSG
jgi:hypothetical protein